MVANGNPKNLHMGFVRFLHAQWKNVKIMSAKLRKVDDDTQSRAFLFEDPA